MGSPRGRSEWGERYPAEWTTVSGELVMANDDKAPNGRGGEPPRPKPKGAERPFDMWLQKQLHAMYDEIASEPLPDDLLKLIDKDAAKTLEALREPRKK
jgi:Anti-sigma factor NepR